MNDAIPIESFENSCVIFDDIDVISNKAIRGAVYALLNKVLEIGRHSEDNGCLCTMHLPTSKGMKVSGIKREHVCGSISRIRNRENTLLVREFMWGG